MMSGSNAIGVRISRAADIRFKLRFALRTLSVLAGVSCLLLWAGTAQAAVSFVQTASSANDSAGSSISQSFSSSNTVGNLIVVAVTWGDSPAPSIRASDTRGNAYLLATTDFDFNHNEGLAIFYAPNIRAGANTVTASFGQADGYRRIIISEFSGVATVSPLDVTANHRGSGTRTANGITSSAAATTANGALIFGVVTDDSGSFGTMTAGSSFTRRAIVGKDTATEDRVQPAAGSVAATFTFSLADDNLAQMAAFRAAGSAPPPPPNPSLSSLNCIPSTLSSGMVSSCNITLTDVAPSGGSAVSLTSSNTTALAVPASVTVPAGAGFASFPATAGAISRNLTVTITASYGNSELLSVFLVPTPPAQLAVTTSSLPDGQVQATYAATLSATGGTAPYSWTLASGQLPAGLSLASSTGIISGPPTAAGTSSFIIEATDRASATATANLSINIAASSSSGSQVTLNSVTLLILNRQSGIPQAISATKGNLIIVSWIFGPGDYVTRITDNQGNTYVPVSPTCDTTWGAGVCGIWYAANARAGVTRITINSAMDSSYNDANIYDVSGAASSPLDRATISGDQTSDVPLGPAITPSSAGGIIISNVGVWSNTLTSVDSPFVFDPQDQNNGWAHVTNDTIGTYTPAWRISGASFEWAAISAAFKAAGQ
jgi:Putative Ig domain